MSAAVPASEIECAYEAVRAQAVGAAPAGTPRGLALLMARGLPAWLAACRSSVPTASPAASAPVAMPLVGPRAQLVSALAEMALASHRRCPA